MRHGSHLNPPNRFEKLHTEVDLDQQPGGGDHRPDHLGRDVEYLDDESLSIVTENRSPDLPFRYSLNPYRGCVHACSYCYARPSHEYLGYNAGRDFETRILVKRAAPRLLRDFLARDAWVPEMIAFSGITDCYQPAERRFEITRQCLQVVDEAKQPIGIVTKNRLIERDLDILSRLATDGLVNVSISITTLDPELARVMEPRTSTPAARLRALTELTTAGVPAAVMVAPIIPGLNDSEIPAILEAATNAGAQSAHSVLLRLPLSVEPVFLEWLQRTQTDKSDRILSRIRSCRKGALNDSQFGSRMRGSGTIADQIQDMFNLFSRKYGLDSPLPGLNHELFVPPRPSSGQMRFC